MIGNPKMFSESDSAARNSAPGGAQGHPPLANNNNIGVHSSVRTNFSNGKPASFQNSGSSIQSYPPTIQPAYQPPSNYKNHGAIMRNEAPARIIPIAALNPYQDRWAIKARVSAKGDLRRYNNAKGDGNVFSFDLLDSDGGEIRVTCFNAVVDRFYDAIEVGKVYVISKGNLKPAQKNFNHLKNEWEIFLEATSSVDLCTDEDASIPKQQFSFRPIGEIENAENNSILDVIGVVVTVNPSVPILRKNGMETQRSILNLKDQSGKVNDFGGKSIGTISATQLFVNPDFPEACRLRDWFDHGGKHTASHSISREIMPGGSKNEIRKTITQIKDEGLGRSDKPDWITVKATISFIKTDTFCYTACPIMIGDRQCNKKVPIY